MGIRDLLGIAGAILGTRGLIIVSLVVGFLIGLILFGWVIWPVQWTDAAPADLHEDYRQVYLETVARIHQIDPSVNLGRLLGGDTWSDEKLERDLNRAFNEAEDAASRTRLVNLGGALGITVDGVVPEPAGRSPLGLVLVFVLVLVLVGGAFILWRLREGATTAPVAVGGDLEKVAASRTVWSEEEAPLLQVTTSYAKGDDYYDPSFSIELPSGEFLGECGMGISEAIGVDDPKKVTAFEVWLFDKSQISTVTKVLMTEFCFHDDALRSKLAPKGEPVLAQEGTLIELETTGLRIQAKVLELEYGEGNLPENSFVERLTVELAAWKLESPDDVVGLASEDDLGLPA